MKIRKTTIVLSVSVIFFAAMFANMRLMSNRAAPPPWYVNDPPQASDCGTPGCHGGGVTTFDSTMFDLKMGTTQANLTSVYNNVATYVPGTTYYMSVTATGSSTRYGFEITAQYDSTDAGTLVDTFALLAGSTTTSLRSTTKGTTVNYVNNSYYVGHMNASTNNTWTFQWTAPTAYTGPIQFYYAGIYANGNGSADAGDHVYNFIKTVTMQPSTTGVNAIADKLTAFNAYPTLMSDHITVTFDLKESSKVDISLLSIQGQTVRTFTQGESMGEGAFRHSYNVNDLPAGFYLIKVQIGDKYTIAKVVKE